MIIAKNKSNKGNVQQFIQKLQILSKTFQYILLLHVHIECHFYCKKGKKCKIVITWLKVFK